MSKEAILEAIGLLELDEAQTHYPSPFLVKAIDILKKALAQEWVGLTSEDIGDALALWELTDEWPTFAHAARAIEARLKEKNNV